MAFLAEIKSKIFTLHPKLADAGLTDKQLTRVAQRAGIKTQETIALHCPLCGKTLNSRNTQYHHCVPVWAGGGDRNVGNLLAICGNCHRVADGLTKIGYVFDRQMDRVDAVNPYLSELKGLNRDPRVINKIRLYRAGTLIVPEVRRLVGEPYGTVFNSGWRYSDGVGEIITEWLPEIESAFGRAYKRRIPDGVSCRRNRLPPPQYADWDFD